MGSDKCRMSEWCVSIGKSKGDIFVYVVGNLGSQCFMFNGSPGFSHWTQWECCSFTME